MILMAATAACGSDAAAPPPEQPAPVVTATIHNRLDVAVNLQAGGTNYGSLARGQSTVLTLPPRTASVGWSAAKRAFSDGSPVPDDLTGTTLSVGMNLGVLDITNVVNGTPYFTPYISSAIADTAWLQVVQPTTSRCIGYQFGATVVPVTWGYYRLDPGTVLRVSRGSNCTGPHLQWSYQQLSGFDVGTGIVRLRIDRLP